MIDSPSPPLLAMRHQSAFSAAENGSCGEIVEVQGGHIVRSTGRKDRHSKVCTAKGPRDRRVRLSAPTAIQFYDVQDRLGFDRPSKAVDWLIKKAKSAIDDLAELPPWNPVDTLRLAAANAKPRRSKTLISPPASRIRGASVSGETEHHHQSSFLPASMDSDSIADTIKSFFPVVTKEAPPRPQIIQQNYHHQPPTSDNFSSRANSQNQDLRLSLQSLENGPPFGNQTEPILFSGQSYPLAFDSSPASWDQQQNHHHQSPEFGKIQRLVTWNNNGSADSTGAGGGFVFASPAATTTSYQPVYGQSQVFSQRGPLQSINTPMIRAWFDPHHHHHHHHQSITTDDLHRHHHHQTYQSAIPGIAFASSGEFSGVRIPPRFHGEQDEHGDKPSSASSDSRH